MDRENLCSSSLVIISKKLHGLCLTSNWYFKISSQPTLHAEGEPGKQKMYVPLATTAKALDCRAEVPIFLYDNSRPI